MKDTLVPGIEYTREIVVDESRAIDFMGKDLRVYATPNVVHDLEYACRDLILEHLDTGEDSVGAKVEIEHTRPTPLGFGVTHKARVDSVDGRRVICKIEIYDEIEKVATATHTRFIVAVDRLKTAIAEKRAKKEKEM
ncbi:MAG: thioesterase family protein [Hyphomicrobiaceae bacterium]